MSRVTGVQEAPPHNDGVPVLPACGLMQTKIARVTCLPIGQVVSFISFLIWMLFSGNRLSYHNTYQPWQRTDFWYTPPLDHRSAKSKEVITMPVRHITSALVSLSVILGGCAMTHAERHGAHHPEGASCCSAALQQSDRSSSGDMTPGCGAMHETMISANSSEERHRMMHEHMQSMTPEMRQRMQEKMGSAC